MKGENSNDKSTENNKSIQTQESTSNEASGSTDNRATTNNEANGSIRSHASSTSSSTLLAGYSPALTMMPVIGSDSSTDNRAPTNNGNAFTPPYPLTPSPPPPHRRPRHRHRRLTARFPDAQLHGFDNDLEQVPHRSWLPENVDIRYWDIFDEVPDERVGKYDFVHVRLVVLVLDGESQVYSLAQKIMKMLKSGGCIQWNELDTVDMSIKKATPETQAPALEQLREKSWVGGRYDWTVEIPGVWREEGFEDVGGKVYGDERGLRRAFNEQHLWTMDEFARRLMGLGMREAAETFWGLVEAVWGRRAALCIPRIMCTGRKAVGL
ncbi:UMTA methyltransferase family protein [Rutstroemia sp. NJR-2017a WRK4]|nr:UMTA methyltransferase family protein [Rutstroemia sp. NJR-2017a WRK4]